MGYVSESENRTTPTYRWSPQGGEQASNSNSATTTTDTSYEGLFTN